MVLGKSVFIFTTQYQTKYHMPHSSITITSQVILGVEGGGEKKKEEEEDNDDKENLRSGRSLAQMQFTLYTSQIQAELLLYQCAWYHSAIITYNKCSICC